MEWYRARKFNNWVRLNMPTRQLLKMHKYKTKQACQKSVVELNVSGQEGGSERTGFESSLVASASQVLRPTHPCQAALFTPRFGRGDAHASCFQGVRLCLVVFIKMASVSYSNVNYCCDTRDNLTCFGNLFFPLIRCSNWKIFQSVTTVLEVKWRRRRGVLATGTQS